jgi:hypothetical protein
MKKKKIFQLKHIVFSMLILLAVMSEMIAQEEKQAPLFVRIDHIIDDNFPNIKAYVVVQDEESSVMAGLAPGLFKFRIDSMELDVRAKITPFAMNESPIDYNIIFSNTGIMDGEPLDFQKNAIIQFVDSMKDDDTLSLYTIGEEAVAIFEEYSKDRIDPALINDVEVNSSQQRFYDSVTNAVRVIERRNIERKVIIIISDGRDQNSRFTKDQMNTVLLEAGVHVYTIGIRVLNTQSLSNLNEMADLTGGSYIYSSVLSAIPDNLKRINSRIIQPYLIEMKVRNMKADELPHVLEISIEERDFIGKGEKTFVAVKVPIPRWVRWAVLLIAFMLIVITIVITIILRIKKRKHMGITKQKCPDCRRRLKDSWDSCPFCKYLINDKKKKTKKEKEN